MSKSKVRVLLGSPACSPDNFGSFGLPALVTKKKMNCMHLKASSTVTHRLYLFINAVHAHVQWFCDRHAFAPNESRNCQIATSSC